MKKVIHKTCGNQVGNWICEQTAHITSECYRRMDGSKPEPGEKFREVCVACGERIQGFQDLTLS